MSLVVSLKSGESEGSLKRRRRRPAGPIIHIEFPSIVVQIFNEFGVQFDARATKSVPPVTVAEGFVPHNGSIQTPNFAKWVPAGRLGVKSWNNDKVLMTSVSDKQGVTLLTWVLGVDSVQRMGLAVLLVGLLLLPAAVDGAECYVTPCTRDVIVVVDGSSSMQTTAYVSQELAMLSKLFNSWTYSESAVRVALVGAYFGNEFIGVDYYTTSANVEGRLNQFKSMSTQYGLFAGFFETMTRFVEERYLSANSPYGFRIDVMRRILFVTAQKNKTDIDQTKSRLQRFTDAGFAVSVIGIGSTHADFADVPLRQYFGISFGSLGSITNAFINSVIDNGICFWDANVPPTPPQLCTTTTTTTTKPTTPGISKTAATAGTTRKSTPVPPTHPPFPVGDYRNCSCNTADLYIGIVFLIDNSKAMGDGLQMIKATISSLVGTMSLDPNRQKHVQVGVITYSDTATVVFNPTDYTDEDEFIEDMFGSPLLKAASKVDEVNLLDGLLAAEEMFEHKMEQGRKKSIVIFASAYNDEGFNDPVQAADQLKASGYSIITVGFIEAGGTNVVLKLGEIASSRMNFTNYKDNLLLDEIEDSLCQVNCYCPNGWDQLILQDRKFGECFLGTGIDANWKISIQECTKISHSGAPHLVYVNSQLKQTHLDKFFTKHWIPSQETPNYYIGLYFNSTFSSFVWTNGVTNPTYFNWAPGQPDMKKGTCAKAVQNSTGAFPWQLVDCVVDTGRAICQDTTCDTDLFCSTKSLSN